MTQELKTIKISDLNLWTENPRDPIGEDIGDLEIIKRALKNDSEKWNIPKLIANMGEFYHFNKLPIVVLKNNKYIVYDGNCRIAILKYLQNPEWVTELEGILFPSGEPNELKNLTEIPCALCEEQTALKIIYSDNLANNTWSPLMQSYFEHNYLKYKKNIFLEFEDLTGLISKHPKLNQRFVKDEVLTEKNLAEIGIKIENGKLLSSNSDSEISKILKELILAVESGRISTRTNEKKESTRLSPTGGLKNILEKSSESNLKISPFYNKKAKKINITKKDCSGLIKNNTTDNKLRKTRTNRKISYILFGGKLLLRKGDVNTLYSALDNIYDKFKNDDRVLPIIGMSLRLLMEVAAREHFENNIGKEKAEKDSIFKEFMKQVKEDKVLEVKQKNLISLDTTELLKVNSFEGLLAKYAHANIKYDRTNILNCSEIIGKILTHYFSKNKQ